MKSVGEATVNTRTGTASGQTVVSRKPVRSAKRVIPSATNAHRLTSLQGHSGQSAKGSILIANSTHQRNYVPPIEYYAKGSFLKIPEHVKTRNSSTKALTSKKLRSIDPVSSPDQVSILLGAVHVQKLTMHTLRVAQSAGIAWQTLIGTSRTALINTPTGYTRNTMAGPIIRS